MNAPASTIPTCPFINRWPHDTLPRPVLIVTSNDGLASDNDKLFTALQQTGDKSAQTLHYDTDHSYSDHRIQLESTIINFLNTINPAP